MQGFEEYVNGTAGRLLRTAFFLTGDLHHAEDLLQIAYERTARHWRRVSRAGNPEAYTRKILTNLAIDRGRKRQRGHDQPVGAPSDVELLARVESGAASFEEAHALGDLLDGALAQLPPRQRAVVVLRYWCDLSEQEIAHTLGVTAGTVKSQASRALAALRGLVDRPTGGTP
ncbi:SigE family RNA polymerase sigma factor [Streptomyces sp. TRM72054]|uniref:SigE family RNA polymerase sigma factor n=1 Tax=Streptomyces sp. TRM72054 TaxID=2870562 RepID=UPI001C8BE2EC|nr:SigE family RNA polymerase sigma factor [Streptomyces sp. TRM72054]MBX9399371.1 SigE family RNA polymerase sigma factor [Streptomyces sp. TRM72054]